MTDISYVQNITLDLNPSNACPVIGAKQNDINSRVLHIQCTKDGINYAIGAGNDVMLRVRKPDMNIAMVSGVRNDDGTVNITLTQQCLTVAGRAYADLLEYNRNGKALSSVAFIINIQASPDVTNAEVASSNDFTYLIDQLARWDQTVAEAEAWAVGTKNSTAVPSTDTTYHNNAKYYSTTAKSYSDLVKNMKITAHVIDTSIQVPVTKNTSSSQWTFDITMPNFSVNPNTGNLEVIY